MLCLLLKFALQLSQQIPDPLNCRKTVVLLTTSERLFSRLITNRYAVVRTFGVKNKSEPIFSLIFHKLLWVLMT